MSDGDWDDEDGADERADDRTTDLVAMLRAIQAEECCTLEDLTVLSPANDPFRTSTMRRRDGEFAMTLTPYHLLNGER